jgi:hypothetical protein
MKHCRSIFLSMLCLIAPSSLHAQTQVQEDRMNTLARYTVTSSVCATLGMTVDGDSGDKFTTALREETASWHVDQSVIERLMSAAFDRQGRMLQIDLQAAAEQAKSEVELRGVKAIFVRYGKICLAAAADPIFSKLIAVPAGYDLDRAATAASDELLEAGGLASWQSSDIRARGDLMMLAGACRTQIGHARSDALVQKYGASEVARVRDYYSKSFDAGLSDTELHFTLSQCDRAIAKNEHAITHAK